MSQENITLHCPKCGENAFQTSANLDLNNSFTCSKCGASVRIGELKTPSGKTLLEHAADMMRDAFNGIKGFKPSR